MERYESYKDSGVEWIGEIPSEWNLVPSKRCVSIANGSDPTAEGSVPVFGSGGASFKTCGEFKQGPAVLLGRKGTIDRPQWVEGRYWNVDTAFDVKELGGECLLRYYFYLAGLFDYSAYQTNTAVPSMTQGSYGNMKIPLPSIEVQGSIVGYLDEKVAEIDALIEATEQSIGLLEEYRRSVISEAVTKGLDPDVPMKDSGVEWIGEIPEGWQVISLARIADEIFDGPFGSHLKSNDYVDEGIRVVRLENLKFLRFDNSKLSYVTREKYESIKRHTVYGCDLILSTFVADSVNVSTLPPDVPFAVNKADCVGIRVPNEVTRQFLRYALSSENSHSFLLSRTHGSTRGRVNTQQIRSIPVALPDIETQKNVVKFLSKIDDTVTGLIDMHSKLLSSLTEYRKSLISEAVTGKFKVPGV